MRSLCTFAFAFTFSVLVHAYPLHPKFEVELENEAQFKGEVVQGILFLQKQEADKNGKYLRGTHAKGICTEAAFEIYDVTELGSRLQKGIFAHAGTYRSVVRFANAAGTIGADSAPDVRAASFAVYMPKEISNEVGRMDFSMNNATTFPLNDSSAFGALMVLAQFGPVNAIGSIGLSRVRAALAAIELGKQQQAPAAQPYQNMRYWSTVPYLLGQDEAIKYSLKPCAGNFSLPLSNDPDALNNELTRHLTVDAEASCFDFQVQLLDEKNMTDAEGKTHVASDWVENATMEWPEAQAPFHTVARLQLKSNAILAQNDCETMNINVNGYTTEDHRGLGSINRARTGAEAASAKQRRGNP